MSADKPISATPEQHAAADPAACVWVGANAGTGKTRVLIDRVTRLLLAGADPSQILCVTYTKAAASEMESRLFARLGGWATQTDSGLKSLLQELQQSELDDDALRRARRLFARALETPGGLKIRTIHAFCESLLRRFPLEAGVPPHFEVLDGLQSAELYAQARQQTLADAQTDDDLPLGSAFNAVAALAEETGFIKLASEIMQKSAPAFDAAGLDGALARLHHRLGVAGGVSAEEFLANACIEPLLPAAELQSIAVALGKGSEPEKKTAATLQMFLQSNDRHLHFSLYKNIFLTQKDEPKVEKFLMTKAAQKHDPGALEIMQREQARIYAVVQHLRAIDMAASSAAALRLGATLRAHYTQAKARRAALDYDDLIGRTLGLLQNHGAAWVHYKLDAGLNHILVDEAQDTSPDQWEIIRLLSDEFFSGASLRTVFAVGDEKQSIYSFQGADPKIFAAMRDRFAERVTAAGRTWRNVDLTESFRSTPKILEAVDTVFQSGAARDGLTSGDGKIIHRATRRGPGLVEIWPPLKQQTADPPGAWQAPLDAVPPASAMALLAQRIVTRIQTWLDSGVKLPATGEVIRPGDIIILVQRRGALVDELIRKLKQSGIAVAGADRMVLATQMAVMDLIVFGQFVLMPEDDLSLATLLRSPLIGLGEDDLFALAHGRAGVPLWRCLCNRAGGNARFADAHRLLAHFLGRADYARPHEFYAELLGPMRGRAKLLARLGPDANDPIDEFLSLALLYERTHAPSLQGFLHWAGRGETTIKRDMEHGGGAVRVMTVHGAKGLEAPIVFLPDACWKPDGKKDPALLPLTGENIHLWPVLRRRDDPAAKAARASVWAARDAEYHRQLYVAMTRARDWLVVCGHHGANSPAEGCWHNLIEAALVPLAHPVTDDEFPYWLMVGDEAAAQGDATTPQTPAAPQPLAGWLSQPAPREASMAAPLSPSRASGAQPPSLPPQDRDTGAKYRRGLLIHRLLQSLPDLPAPLRHDRARRYLSQPAHALSDAEIDAMISETLAVIDAPEFAAVFAPGSRAEAPIAGIVPKLGNRTISGQIDRLCVTGREILIVDYKSDRVIPPAAAGVAVAYLWQMAAYRAALQEIYPNHAVRCALLWTGAPLLMPLPDALLDTALAELVLDVAGARS